MHPDENGEIRLLAGTSHALGILKRYKFFSEKKRPIKQKRLSYLCYPGFSLTTPEHWKMILEDLWRIKKNYKVKDLHLHFGSNDTAKVSSLIFPRDDDVRQAELDDAIINGISKEEYLGDISDPLNILHLYPRDVLEEYDSLYDDLFARVDQLCTLLSPEHLGLYTTMGRYLKGRSSSIGYNRAAYYFRYRLHCREIKKRGETGPEHHLLDLFEEQWTQGTDNLLKYHRAREEWLVIFQELYYPRFGGVHYCDGIYAKLLYHILETIPHTY